MGDEVGRAPIDPSVEVYDQELYREGDVVPESGRYECVFDGLVRRYNEEELFEPCDNGHGLDDACWKYID